MSTFKSVATIFLAVLAAEFSVSALVKKLDDKGRKR